MFLAGLGTNILEKSAFSSASFTGKEHRTTGIANQVPSILELKVVKVNILKNDAVHATLRKSAQK